MIVVNMEVNTLFDGNNLFIHIYISICIYISDQLVEANQSLSVLHASVTEMETSFDRDRQAFRLSQESLNSTIVELKRENETLYEEKGIFERKYSELVR